MFRNVISKRLSSIIEVHNKQMCTQVKLEKTINQITLLGRIGGDPQRKGDFVQKTDWHKVCVFKPLLRETVMNYMKRGQRVLVMGKISYTEYKDSEGQTKNGTAVLADDVVFFQKS
ncbi:mitochondrial single stranded DNA-binding protein isoform X4 [Augochlora pura]